MTTYTHACEILIMRGLARRKCLQVDIAMIYAARMHYVRQEEGDLGAAETFGPINRAITERWSVSGLNRIKRMAWKRTEVPDVVAALIRRTAAQESDAPQEEVSPDA